MSDMSVSTRTPAEGLSPGNPGWSNVLPNMARLYDETTVNVLGHNISPEIKTKVTDVAKRANAAVLNAMEEHGIYPVGYNGTLNVSLEHYFPPSSNGLARAAADGKMLYENRAVTPGFDEYYYTRDFYGGIKGGIADLLYNDLKTEEIAYEKMRMDMIHELIHNYVHLNKIRDKDGNVAEKTLDEAIKEPYQKYIDNAPDCLKPIVRYIIKQEAEKTYEGFVETAAINVSEGKSTYQVKREKEIPNTTYDVFAGTEAKVLHLNGYSSHAFELPKEFVTNRNVMKNYVNSTLRN